MQFTLSLVTGDIQNGMNTLIEHEGDLFLLIDEAVSQDPLKEKPSVSWSVFLTQLERFCAAHCWSVEYDDVTDGSCAIFAYETLEPEERSNERAVS